MNLFINMNDRLGVRMGSVVAELDMPLKTSQLICERYASGDDVEKQLVRECITIAVKSKPVRIGNYYELHHTNDPMIVIGPQPRKIPRSVVENRYYERVSKCESK